MTVSAIGIETIKVKSQECLPQFMTERSERMVKEHKITNTPHFLLTPKPVYTPLALRDWSGAAPEPAMAKIKCVWQVVALTA